MLFARGFLIGLSISAPVGPIGVLCIRRTLAYGRFAGFISGLGAATADFGFGCVAAIGLSALIQPLIGAQYLFRVGGGLFLIYLGWKIFREHPATEAATIGASGLLGCYTSTFVLTAANPITILTFLAIFAGAGAAQTSGIAAGFILAAGVFIGSASWWLTLSGVTGAVGKRLTSDGMVWVNRLAGVIVSGFGVAAMASAVWHT